MRPDSLLRLWRCINPLLTYLLTCLLTCAFERVQNDDAEKCRRRADFPTVNSGRDTAVTTIIDTSTAFPRNRRHSENAGCRRSDAPRAPLSIRYHLVNDVPYYIRQSINHKSKHSFISRPTHSHTPIFCIVSSG